MQGDDGTGVSALGEVFPTARGQRSYPFLTVNYFYKLDARGGGFVSAHLSDTGDWNSGNQARNVHRW